MFSRRTMDRRFDTRSRKFTAPESTYRESVRLDRTPTCSRSATAGSATRVGAGSEPIEDGQGYAA